MVNTQSRAVYSAFQEHPCPALKVSSRNSWARSGYAIYLDKVVNLSFYGLMHGLAK